jgi:Meckel syndrome type 1 protein
VEPARLTSSARPQLAPRRSTPQTSTPSADAAPRVPANPLPFEATQRRTERVNSARPPQRALRAVPAAAAASPAAAPAAETPSATASNSAPRLRGSARPPKRPEGSAPDLILDEGAQLTPTETDHLRRLRQTLEQAQAPGIGRLPPDSMLAQARPQRKPGSLGAATSSDAVSASAIDAAVRSATGSPPDKPQRADAAAPARDSGGLLHSSARPRARPGTGNGGVDRLSDAAVQAAIAAAVDASPATPGGVQLSALASSPLPPRRGDADGTPDGDASAAPDAAPDASAPEASEPGGPNEAEQAERRRLDEQLQAQAEARVRARAQADAQAEAQARAQAEARARAQAEAEERAALAKRQQYKPPEVDDEPEIAATALSKGVTSASVAKSATQKRGMNPDRTTIIGIIGAGQASRALIRLRNGKVVTVRLGDRIDGGTINSIGDGRITYVKSGRTHELRMLDGR